MKKLKIVLLTLIFLLSSMTLASATELWYWGYNIDGSFTEGEPGDSMPVTGSLDPAGLGALTWTTSVAGTHSFIAYFDHDIFFFDEEYGEVSGSPVAGQSWEIGEADWFDPSSGALISKVASGASLGNTNGVPDMGDVSWAMGWDFTVAAGETALITLNLSDVLPSDPFYLSQSDGFETIFFSSTLEIRGGQAPVPEPATMVLLGTGLVGLFGVGKRRFKK